MDEAHRKNNWVLPAGIVLVMATIALVFLLGQVRSGSSPEKALPVIGPIADFSLTNQNAQAVSLADLQGQVWVADIIFTTCPGPCARMTRQMRDIQEALRKNSGVRLVSLTTNPDFDTPPILKAYAERFGADPARWQFLTGTKREIGRLATDSLKLVAVEKQPEQRESPDDLFIHSTMFVIVDKHARLRGVFETGGEDIDPKKVREQIVAAARQLERES